MNMELTEEQQMIQQTARKFFEKEVPPELVRELQFSDSNGHSEKLWRKMAETGWLGLNIPEEYGGSGASLVDLGIVYEESGRVLTPTPLYSTIYASFVISELGTEQQKKELLPEIANGKMIGTVAFTEKNAFHNTDCFQTVAKKKKGRWILSGSKAFVPNAHLSEPLIVIARTQDDFGNEGLAAFLVSKEDEGVSLNPQITFGKDRQFIVDFNHVNLGTENMLGETTQEVESGLAEAMKKAIALQCVEMAGGARKVIDMTVNYVSERHQFGVPIGSFQAVQHHLANMVTAVDGAQLLGYQAVSFLSERLSAEDEVAIAKAHASETYKSITNMAHQLWGGMGYATESDLFLWSNRAKAAELSYGPRDHHLVKVASRL